MLVSDFTSIENTFCCAQSNHQHGGSLHVPHMNSFTMHVYVTWDIFWKYVVRLRQELMHSRSKMVITPDALEWAWVTPYTNEFNGRISFLCRQTLLFWSLAVLAAYCACMWSDSDITVLGFYNSYEIKSGSGLGMRLCCLCNTNAQLAHACPTVHCIDLLLISFGTKIQLK